MYTLCAKTKHNNPTFEQASWNVLDWMAADQNVSHATMIKNVHSLSTLQQDIAKQIVQQHQDVHNLYIALGLKKELSYYQL